jgi:predicted transcriptional regulator
MKIITINVSEPVYRDFQEYARQHDRTASEIIREAMEDFRTRRIRPQSTLRNMRPTSVGSVLIPFTGAEDVLGELTDDQGR